MFETAQTGLVAEDPQVVPTVRVDAVWRELCALIYASPARAEFAVHYAEIEDEGEAEHVADVRLEAAASAVLNLCIRHGIISVRIFQSAKWLKLPAAAFVPEADLIQGLANAQKTTWSPGVLSRNDTTEQFWAIADGNFPLLITENEAELVRRQAHDMIANEELERNKAIRRDILDRASRGLLRIEEAEAEAERQGVGALAFRPSPEKHDPRNRPDWTFPMALVWIAWRDFDEVREWDPDFAAECREWKVSDEFPNGRFLGRRTKESVWRFQCLGHLRWHERDPANIKRVVNHDLAKDTKSELWSALKEGKVTAHGIRWSAPKKGEVTVHGIPWFTGKRKNISKIEWNDLEVDREDSFRYRGQPVGRPAYTELYVPRDEVTALWPIRLTNQPETPETDGGSSAEPVESLEETIQRLGAEHGGYLTLNEGARLVREIHPHAKRDVVRGMIKKLFNNEKRGPRGPRS